MQPAELIGQRFSFLVVVEKAASPTGQRGLFWRCQCDCGKEVVASTAVLRRGQKRGCGCILTRGRVDLAGQRFGMLVAATRCTEPGKVNFWQCFCDCGKGVMVQGTKLTSGRQISCGCNRPRQTAERNRTHGLSGTSEWRIWAGMKKRCLNESDAAYRHYGGRGIYVCDRWLESFENFYEDMGPRPSPDHTIDRIDNDGPYSPGNCRWATMDVQSSNTRKARLITMDGRTNTLHGWAREIGINVMSLHRRLKSGWGEQDILAPKGVRGHVPQGEGQHKEDKGGA